MPATAPKPVPPPCAIPIWTDGRDLYTIIPGPNGPTYLRYPRTIAGLSSALGIITSRAYDTSAGPAQPSASYHRSAYDHAGDQLRALGLPVP
jgi:hypothetical protein